MNEVSCRAISAIFDAATTLGVDTRRILEESELSEQDLRNPRKRVDWDAAVRFQGALVAQLGEGEPLVELGRAAMRHGCWGGLGKALSMVTSPHALYYAMNRWAGPASFTHILSQYRVMPDQSIEMELRIPEGFSDSAPFFEISLGSIEAAPMMLGMSKSRVEMELAPRVARYRVFPPRHSGLISRFRGAWGAFKGDATFVEELGLQIEDRNAVIANLRERERALSEQQKLAALGELSAGIAHDIKNPLSTIRLTSRVLMDEDLSQHPPAWSNNAIARIHGDAIRIEKIVNALARFSRQRPEDPMVPVQVTQLANDALSLVHEQLHSQSIDTNMVTHGDTPTVLCRPEEICQVLLNLIQNSIDAIQSVEKKWVKIECTVRDGQVFVTVTDCGNGLSPELSDKIFRSFYTTKPRGKGTGLGLSISRRIIEEHGGSLQYVSTSPHTQFLMTLPSYCGGPGSVSGSEAKA